MVAALDEIIKTFIVYVAMLSTLIMQVYPSCQAQIRLLMANKALINVPPKYLNYIDIFLFGFTII